MTSHIARFLIFDGENERGCIPADRVQEIKPHENGVAVTFVDQTISTFDVPYDDVMKAFCLTLSAEAKIRERQTDAAELQALLEARRALSQDLVENENGVIVEHYGFMREAKRKRWHHLSDRIDQLTGYEKEAQ